MSIPSNAKTCSSERGKQAQLSSLFLCSPFAFVPGERFDDRVYFAVAGRFDFCWPSLSLERVIPPIIVMTVQKSLTSHVCRPPCTRNAWRGT